MVHKKKKTPVFAVTSMFFNRLSLLRCVLVAEMRAHAHTHAAHPPYIHTVTHVHAHTHTDTHTHTVRAHGTNAQTLTAGKHDQSGF